jgi:hypothetical protein
MSSKRTASNSPPRSPATSSYKGAKIEGPSFSLWTRPVGGPKSFAGSNTTKRTFGSEAGPQEEESESSSGSDDEIPFQAIDDKKHKGPKILLNGKRIKCARPGSPSRETSTSRHNTGGEEKAGVSEPRVDPSLEPGFTTIGFLHPSSAKSPSRRR